MQTPPRPRDRQRGNSMVLSLIVLSALATLGSLTVVSVQSSLKASTNDRSQAVAMFAAESGGAMAIQFLRQHFDNGGSYWSAYVNRRNNPPFAIPPAQMPSNGAQPGAPNNPFSADQRAWYEIVVLNNRDDPQFDTGGDNDQDGRVTIRSTGHGPQGALAIVEWEIARARIDPPPATPPTPPLSPITLDTVTPTDPVILLGWRVVL